MPFSQNYKIQCRINLPSDGGGDKGAGPSDIWRHFFRFQLQHCYNSNTWICLGMTDRWICLMNFRHCYNSNRWICLGNNRIKDPVDLPDLKPTKKWKNLHRRPLGTPKSRKIDQTIKGHVQNVCQTIKGHVQNLWGRFLPTKKNTCGRTLGRKGLAKCNETFKNHRNTSWKIQELYFFRINKSNVKLNFRNAVFSEL